MFEPISRPLHGLVTDYPYVALSKPREMTPEELPAPRVGGYLNR